jgi:hypothetical protein
MTDGGRAGIGNSMTPTVSGLAWGEVPINAKQEITLTSTSFPAFAGGSFLGINIPPTPAATQTAGIDVEGTLWVYHELGHGLDRYLVVYIGDGNVTPGSPSIADQRLTGGDRSALAPDLARGYFHYRMETGLHVTAADPSRQGLITLKEHSPLNVNQSVQVTDSVTSEYSTSISLSGSGGGGSGSVSASHSTSVGHSVTRTITDWGIDDVSAPAEASCHWVYYQNSPWDGRNQAAGFPNWWEQAYDMGGGWDSARPPTQLSRGVLPFTVIASWYFDKDMVDANGQLNVTFSGTTTAYFCMVKMPQLNNSGHHQLEPASLTCSWSKTVDLVSLAKLT